MVRSRGSKAGQHEQATAMGAALKQARSTRQTSGCAGSLGITEFAAGAEAVVIVRVRLCLASGVAILVCLVLAYQEPRRKAGVTYSHTPDHNGSESDLFRRFLQHKPESGSHAACGEQFGSPAIVRSQQVSSPLELRQQFPLKSIPGYDWDMPLQKALGHVYPSLVSTKSNKAWYLSLLLDPLRMSKSLASQVIPRPLQCVVHVSLPFPARNQCTSSTSVGAASFGGTMWGGAPLCAALTLS